MTLQELKADLGTSLDDIEAWLAQNAPGGSPPAGSEVSLNWLCMRLANWADELNSLKATFMFEDPAAYAQAHREWKRVLKIRKKLLHATIREQDADLTAAMQRFAGAAPGLIGISQRSRDQVPKQEYAGQDDRPRGRRLDVGVRQPGMHRPHGQLHREGGEEGQP